MIGICIVPFKKNDTHTPGPTTTINKAPNDNNKNYLDPARDLGLGQLRRLRLPRRLEQLAAVNVRT